MIQQIHPHVRVAIKNRMKENIKGRMRKRQREREEK
jgi:hypothetical protein